MESKDMVLLTDPNLARPSSQDDEYNPHRVWNHCHDGGTIDSGVGEPYVWDGTTHKRWVNTIHSTFYLNKCSTDSYQL